MKRFITFSIFIAFFVTACTQQNSAGHNENQVLTHILQQREIRCGYVLYPPFMGRDIASGKVNGIMPQIWEEIGRRLDLKITWSEETSWGNMITGLQEGRYDAVCSTVWANGQRAKFVNFSVPLGYEHISLYAHANDTRFDNRINSLNDPAIRFSTLDGEMGSMIVGRRFSRAKNISVPQNASVADMLNNVATGKADLVIADPLIVEGYLKTNPGSLRIVVGGETIQRFPVTVLLPQNDIAFKTMIDQTIEELKNDGTIQEIMNRSGLPHQWDGK